MALTFLAVCVCSQ